ncbi:hypothetical protein CEW88_11565 [Alloyangia pacifica]|uniref:Integrase DNA-binding domain-containing protein n=1 Tax=Alloyangia pacifica TaxID=311180 RepID=A0A2U8HHP0_9RHOB|nr:integrase arm-type DNA-binding domain-containing protein [Alloyangia pacifica]AWI84265.1 hypothetical protein CEW88_11565 [Alloyangia pacifica]
MKTETITARIGAKTFRETELPEGCRELVIKDSDLTGYVLRLTRGAASYVYRGRVAGSGQRRAVVLGDAKLLPASEARKAAERTRARFRAGHDPVLEAEAEADRAEAEAELARIEAERKAAEDAAEAARRTPLGGFLDLYLTKFEAGHLTDQRRTPTPESVRSEKVTADRLKRMLGADLGVGDIDLAACRKLRAGLGEFAGTTQKKTYGLLGRVLDAALDEGLIDGNPARLLKTPKTSMKRERYLSREELRAVWDASHKLAEYGRGIRILTACPVRASLLKVMSGYTVKDGAFHVPSDAEGNKSRVAWVMPLTALALEQLGDPVQPPRTMNDSTCQAKLMKLSGVTDWTPHDLRRSYATLLGDAAPDLSRADIDSYLLHKPHGLEAVYSLSQRTAALRTVAARWDTVLRDILRGADGNVVPLHG